MTKPRSRGASRSSRPVSRILSRVTIPLGRRLPVGSSGVPDPSAGRVNGICFALHRVGFGEPPCRHDAGGLLPHRFTPYRRNLARRSAGGLLSVPLSVGFRRLGFPQHSALRCPDFPRTLARPAVTRPAPRSVALLRRRLACPRRRTPAPARAVLSSAPDAFSRPGRRSGTGSAAIASRPSARLEPHSGQAITPPRACSTNSPHTQALEARAAGERRQLLVERAVERRRRHQRLRNTLTTLPSTWTWFA